MHLDSERGIGADRAAAPPRHNLEAERAVLGAVLLAPDVLATVAAVVAPADFYAPAHALIFETMLALQARREPLDSVTLGAALRGVARLNAVGGAAYVGELTAAVSTTAHAEQHARLVQQDAAVRRLVDAAWAVCVRGADHAQPAEAFLEWATARVAAAAQVRRTPRLVPLRECILESFDHLEKAQRDGRQRVGVETGFVDLDALLAGLAGGQVVIIAGRPAMGKTSVGTQIAHHVARTTGRTVLFFSLEMPRTELANRLTCAAARVDLQRLRNLALTQDDMAAFVAAAQDLSELPMQIDDSGDLTLFELRAAARAAKLQGDLALVVIDYLQLMRASRDGMENREREVSEISRGLKALAKELDVPIVALSQLNRGPETRAGKDKRPQLSDLRESGAIEQDADVVMFVYRDEVYNKTSPDRGIAELIVAKQRNGPTDTVRLRFIRELTRFENLAAADDAVAAPAAPPARTYPAARAPGAPGYAPHDSEDRDDGDF